VELAMSVPEQVITHGNVSKYILKKAVRGVIPDATIDRQKQGFGVPIQQWFLAHFGDFASRELADFCDKTDFLDKPAVVQLIQSGRARDAWVLLNFALWWKQFIAGENPFMASQTESLVATR
jgi:asparagine synthase (glutamine-hydrolysing)